MRGDRARLVDILDAIADIERIAARGRDAFESDELVREYIIGRIQVIGEAAGAISAELQRNHPEIPWPKMVGMRNVLVHEHFRILRGRVWKVVEDDLPSLRRQIEDVLAELAGE